MEPSLEIFLDEVVGRMMFYCGMYIVLISLISTMVQYTQQTRCDQVPARRGLICPLPNATAAEEFPELPDSISQLLSLDRNLLSTGSDVPFHLVKQLSSEFTKATRSYLEKMDSIPVPSL